MTSSDSGPVVLRPTAVRVLAVLTWTLMGFYLAWTLLVDVGVGLRFAPVAALVSAVVFALFWRPGVAVDDDGVTLLNVVRDVRIPFSRLRSMQTRYALQMETTDGTYTAWAAPAPGRTSAMSLSRREASGVELLGADLTQGMSASAAPNTDSGAAALLVRHQWSRWTDRHGDAERPADDPDVTSRWVLPVLVLVGLCAAATAVALLS